MLCPLTTPEHPERQAQGKTVATIQKASWPHDTQLFRLTFLLDWVFFPQNPIVQALRACWTQDYFLSSSKETAWKASLGTGICPAQRGHAALRPFPQQDPGSYASSESCTRKLGRTLGSLLLTAADCQWQLVFIPNSRSSTAPTVLSRRLRSSSRFHCR